MLDAFHHHKFLLIAIFLLDWDRSLFSLPFLIRDVEQSGNPTACSLLSALLQFASSSQLENGGVFDIARLCGSSTPSLAFTAENLSCPTGWMALDGGNANNVFPSFLQQRGSGDLTGDTPGILTSSFFLFSILHNRFTAAIPLLSPSRHSSFSFITLSFVFMLTPSFLSTS